VNYFFRRWFGELTKEPQGQAPVAGKEGTIRTSPVEETVEGEPRRRLDNRYELLAPLGLGSSGEVYKAHDTLLRTVVAVKLLRREYCIDEAAVERLRREVLLARDLSHPNLLKIYHLGEDRGQRYITMQYVDGPDLGKVIAAQAPLPADQAVAIAGKLASALAALHRCAVLHRDIKPSNVLIDEAGEPRITDFGLARLKWAPGVTSSGTFLGTPAYASPEQALGESLDERSDLYALGLVLFEMVTGRPPFAGGSLHEQLFIRLRVEPPAPRELVPAIPAALSDLILRCLAQDRSQRFQSAGELHAALEALRKPG
jgi:serine/threonine protein kinase